MDRRLQLKTSCAACMLFLFVFISFFGTEGTLLCFGKDGHVAIELVDACNEAGAGPEMKQSDACGPCTDIQLGISGGFPTSQLTKLPLVSVSPVSGCLSLDEHLTGSISMPRLHIKRLSALHSVVLLI